MSRRAHDNAAAEALPADATAADKTKPSARWEALFGCLAPQRLPRFVEQAIAWEEQRLRHGDVSPAIAHDLQLAVEHARQQRGTEGSGLVIEAPSAAVPAVALRDGSTKSVAPAAAAATVRLSPAQGRRSAPLPPASSQLLPGSQLVKAYGGRNHVVAVEPDGFRYEGEVFSSLSAIAKHITGTHWNGLLFFGLRKRRTYPPKPRRHG